MSDKQRADALATVIHDLKWLVTTYHESKSDFIESVKKILGTDPDLLASELHKDIFNAESRIKQLEQELEEAQKDKARYNWIQDWLESRVKSTPAFCSALSREEYNQAIDAAIKESNK